MRGGAAVAKRIGSFSTGDVTLDLPVIRGLRPIAASLGEEGWGSVLREGGASSWRNEGLNSPSAAVTGVEAQFGEGPIAFCLEVSEPRPYKKFPQWRKAL